MVKHSERKHSPGFFGRLLRSLVSITILTTLVLGITFSVKQLSTLDSQKLVNMSSPVLAKLGLDEEQVGEVAGALVEKVSEVDSTLNSEDIAIKETTEDEKQLELTIAIMSDAEDDTANMTKALDLAKENNVNAVFYLGDFTSWGDTASLMKMKDILDQSGLNYFAIPGDHDLAASVQDGDVSGLENFKSVFGDYFHSVSMGNYKFIVMNNAANFTPLSEDQMSWFTSEVSTADYVLLSQPLYHPTIKLYMGIVDGQEVAEVKLQGITLLDTIRQSNVKAIIAGDQHNFSKSADVEKGELEHIVTGALVGNESELRNPQKPRFTLLQLFTDGTYKVKEVVL